MYIYIYIYIHIIAHIYIYIYVLLQGTSRLGRNWVITWVAQLPTAYLFGGTTCPTLLL